jgi:hypothetical protein
MLGIWCGKRLYVVHLFQNSNNHYRANNNYFEVQNNHYRDLTVLNVLLDGTSYVLLNAFGAVILVISAKHFAEKYRVYYCALGSYRMHASMR